jgi:hypothetical protein
MNELAPIQNPNSAHELAFIGGIRDDYTFQVRSWLAWMKRTGNGVTEDGIRAYFAWLNDGSGYTANTVRNKRQAVKKRVRQLFHDAPVDERVKIDRLLTDLDHDTETKGPKINSEAVTRDRVITSAEYQEMLFRSRSDRQRAFI